MTYRLAAALTPSYEDVARRGALRRPRRTALPARAHRSRVLRAVLRPETAVARGLGPG